MFHIRDELKMADGFLARLGFLCLALCELALFVGAVPAFAQSTETVASSPLEQASEPSSGIAMPTQLVVKSSQLLPPPPSLLDRPAIAYSQSAAQNPSVDAVAGKLGQLGQPAPDARKRKHRAKLSVAQERNPAASSYLAQAWAASQAGDGLAALREVERALAEAPTDPDGLILKAYVLSTMERHDDSVDTLHGLLAHHPRHVEALRYLAMELGQSTTPQALKALEDMASVDPSNALVQVSLARRYDRDQNESRDLMAFDRAARLAPHNIAYRVELASLYDRYGYPSQAALLYRQAFETARVRQESGELDPVLSQDLLRSVRTRADFLDRSFLRARRGAPDESLAQPWEQE